MKRRILSLVLALCIAISLIPSAAAAPSNPLESISYYGDLSQCKMTALQAEAFAAVIRSEQQKQRQAAQSMGLDGSCRYDEQVALFDPGSGVPAMLFFSTILTRDGASCDGGYNSLWQWADGRAVQLIPKNGFSVSALHIYPDYILTVNGNITMREDLRNLAVLPFRNGRIDPVPSTTANYMTDYGKVVLSQVDGRNVPEAEVQAWMQQHGSGNPGEALAGYYYYRQGVYTVKGMTEADGALAALEAYMEAEAVAGFYDVPKDAFFAAPVSWAVDRGITNGVDSTHFGPQIPCTRAQAVTFLWRAAGQPRPKAAATPFTDLKPGAFYEMAVAWAVENGITAGTSATRFSPDAPCSRAQIVTFLWRAAGSPAVGNGNSFADVPAGSYYEIPVRWAVSMNITNGVSATRFAPDNPCTRGQIVTFLYRARNVKIAPNPNAWSSAYKSFVLNRSFLNSGPEYSSEAGFYLVRLYDLDRDGTPELIIDNGGAGRAVRWAYIYTYSGGQIRYLDIGPSETYCDPANPAGIYGRYSISPDENWTKYVKSGMQILTSSAGTFPLFTGHTDFRLLTTKTVEQIREMGWDAFLATQAIG